MTVSSPLSSTFRFYTTPLKCSSIVPTPFFLYTVYFIHSLEWADQGQDGLSAGRQASGSGSISHRVSSLQTQQELTWSLPSPTKLMLLVPRTSGFLTWICWVYFQGRKCLLELGTIILMDAVHPKVPEVVGVVVRKGSTDSREAQLLKPAGWGFLEAHLRPVPCMVGPGCEESAWGGSF